MSSEKNEKLEIRWTNADELDDETAPLWQEDLIKAWEVFLKENPAAIQPPNPRYSIYYPGSELAHYENY